MQVYGVIRMGQPVAEWLVCILQEADIMIRLGVFFLGLGIALLAWPQVQLHHARAELMQLAWCSSGGSAAPGTSFFAMHCVWCPAFLAGVAAMVAAPFLNQVRPVFLSLRAMAK